MLKHEVRLACPSCNSEYDHVLYPVQLSCGLLYCQTCIDRGRHLLDRNKNCTVHKRNCFASKAGLRSIDAAHLLEQMAAVAKVWALVVSSQPKEDPTETEQLEDLEATKVILQNMHEKQQEELRSLQKAERLLKQQNTSIKKFVSKFQNSLRNELENEIDERKRLEKEFQLATLEFSKVNSAWSQQLERAKAEAGQSKKRQGKPSTKERRKERTQAVASQGSKWQQILSQQSTEATEGEETVESAGIQVVLPDCLGNGYKGHNPFAILEQNDDVV